MVYFLSDFEPDNLLNEFWPINNSTTFILKYQSFLDLHFYTMYDSKTKRCDSMPVNKTYAFVYNITLNKRGNWLDMTALPLHHRTKILVRCLMMLQTTARNTRSHVRLHRILNGHGLYLSALVADETPHDPHLATVSIAMRRHD